MNDLDYQVKGSSLISKIDYVDERFGVDHATELEDRLATRLDLPFYASHWYSFELYDALLSYICDRFFEGRIDDLVDLGRYSAKVALQGVYRIYCQDRDFSTFLDRLASLHHNFYNLGQMKVTKGSDGCSCSIHRFNAPVYTPVDGAVSAGFFAGSAELMGNRLEFLEYHVSEKEALFQMRWKEAE